MIFSTKVHGIPCQCQVDYYSPYRPMKVYGTGFGDAHPPEPTEFKFTLLDRKGYRAGWLEKHLQDADVQRLVEEYEASRLADQFDIHF